MGGLNRLLLLTALLALVAAFWTFRVLRPSGVDVAARGETQAFPHGGDAAEDPAIWVHPTRPAESLILAANQRGGLLVYELDGDQRQFVAVGDLNAVDVRDDFPFAGGTIPLVAASDGDRERVVFLRVDPIDRWLRRTGHALQLEIDPDELCLHHAADGSFYLFVSGRVEGGHSRVEQWRLTEEPEARLSCTRVRQIPIDGAVGGMVADDALGVLYVAEQERGIWRFDAAPGGPLVGRLIDDVTVSGRLRKDVEGLALYARDDGTGFLIASSQGSDDFVVYTREGDNAYAGRFAIEEGRRADRVTHTDGIEVTSRSLGPQYPDGLFVAQDADNEGGRQNFKLVPWRRIEKRLAE